MICYDIYPNDSAAKYGEYVSLDTLFREADIITLHAPITEDNFHMIDAEALAKMKQGVVIVNTGRGGLIDSKALADAVESGKVGAAALDVIENAEKILSSVTIPLPLLFLNNLESLL